MCVMDVCVFVHPSPFPSPHPCTTFRFFERTKDNLKCSNGAKTLVEVAGGHGLLGILCAIFKKERFDQVVIADITRQV